MNPFPWHLIAHCWNLPSGFKRRCICNPGRSLNIAMHKNTISFRAESNLCGNQKHHIWRTHYQKLCSGLEQLNTELKAACLVLVVYMPAESIWEQQRSGVPKLPKINTHRVSNILSKANLKSPKKCKAGFVPDILAHTEINGKSLLWI